MRRLAYASFVVLALFLAGCGASEPVCAPGSITYAEGLAGFPAAAPGGEGLAPTPSSVTIGGKLVEVDQVIHGSLCNASLSGKVYVACDLTLQKWEGAPNFLTGCDFKVAPRTVIYVAHHNDAAYYNGCAACHSADAH